MSTIYQPVSDLISGIVGLIAHTSKEPEPSTDSTIALTSEEKQHIKFEILDGVDLSKLPLKVEVDSPDNSKFIVFNLTNLADPINFKYKDAAEHKLAQEHKLYSKLGYNVHIEDIDKNLRQLQDDGIGHVRFSKDEVIYLPRNASVEDIAPILDCLKTGLCIEIQEAVKGIVANIQSYYNKKENLARTKIFEVNLYQAVTGSELIFVHCQLGRRWFNRKLNILHLISFPFGELLELSINVRNFQLRESKES